MGSEHPSTVPAYTGLILHGDERPFALVLVKRGLRARLTYGGEHPSLLVRRRRDQRRVSLYGSEHPLLGRALQRAERQARPVSSCTGMSTHFLADSPAAVMVGGRSHLWE